MVGICCGFFHPLVKVMHLAAGMLKAVPDFVFIAVSSVVVSILFNWFCCDNRDADVRMKERCGITVRS